MKLGSSLWLRFGLVGAGIGVFGVLLTTIVMSDVKFSSATDGGIVSIATVDTAVGFEMNSGAFDVYTGSSEAAASAPRAIAVYTNSSAGLSFKIGASSNSLVYKNVSTVADTFTAVSGSTTLANMTAGTWGYAASTGSNCGNTYKGVPTTPTDLISASTFATAGNYNVNLCIGAKGSTSKAEGAYAGQFTLSVTAKSAPVRYSAIYLDAAEDGGATTLGTDSASDSSATHSFTLNNSYTKEGYELVGWKLDNAGTTLNPGATVTLQSSNPTGKYYAVWEAKTYTMQTVADWGDELEIEDSIQAVDERDGKSYWVTRLADGNIWMTQNLDFDIEADTEYTHWDTDLGWGEENYDEDATWMPDVATYTDSTWYDVSDSYINPESYDPGNYYIRDGVDGVFSSVDDDLDLEDEKDREQLHYHVGNYYNWTAAVAMNDSSEWYESEDDTDQSICPAGWMLPKSGYNQTDSGSFYGLVSQYGWNSGSYRMEGDYSMWGAPLSFVLGGGWYGYSDVVDGSGHYWSSVVSGGGSALFGLYFGSDGFVTPQNYLDREYGFSVRCVARPKSGGYTMQTVADWGDELSEGDSVQAIDSRDGKTYWVTRLADGNIWMTQNLDLNITTAGLSSADTDITTDWNASSERPPVATLTDASQYNNSDSTTSTASWDAGNWYYDGISSTTSCDSGKTTYEGCTGFSNTGNAHYHVGNMYSWGAATAGTGGAITSGQSEGSICPKGWRLPMSSGDPSFANLQSKGSLGSTVQNWLNEPYYFTRTGGLWHDSDKLYAAGNDGLYWSSTPYSGGSSAYYLGFDGISSVLPAFRSDRALGMSVRCVAR